MKKYIILGLLTLVTLTGAVLEGLVEGLPQILVQINGGLTILAAMALVAWTLRLQATDI